MSDAKKFEATEDTIGDGWSDPVATVDRWNDFIAPVLWEHTPADLEDPLVSAAPGIAQPAAEWAWAEFCGRGAGESDEATALLASDLRAKLRPFDLMSSDTAQRIRRATPGEVTESLRCGQPEGHIRVEIDGEMVRCYVMEA